MKKKKKKKERKKCSTQDSRFGKRPDHCIEEDILEKGNGKLGSMCVKSWFWIILEGEM